MIHIEKNQAVPENENMRVFSATGDYEDNDLIEFYSIENPDVVSGAFAAQFIAYGSMVYGFSNPVELGNEILKIDPKSNHSAASFVRMQNELLAQFNQGSLTPESLDVLNEEEQLKQEEALNDTNLGQKDIEEGIKEAKDSIEKLEEELSQTEETVPSTPTAEVPPVTETVVETVPENITAPVEVAPQTSEEPVVLPPAESAPIASEEIVEPATQSVETPSEPAPEATPVQETEPTTPTS